MYASVASYTLQGIHGRQVTVEVDVSNGLQNFHLVGLPSASVRESKDRVRAAIQNSGFTFPLGRITINLAPADLRKEGPALDLPICIGILIASGQITADKSKCCAFLGEIALDGSLLPIKGALGLIRTSAEQGHKQVFISAANPVFRDLVPDIEVVRVLSLQHCVAVLHGRAQSVKLGAAELPICGPEYPSIDQVKGQWQAKRAIVIAAAGGHHLLRLGYIAMINQNQARSRLHTISNIGV
ncbi:MAG: magnesium chelatase [Bacilli bacterium]|nr:magnesium chelatase [Bacilli bacterium]